MKSTLHYSICPANPQTHLFKVSLTITDPNPAGETVYLPVWTPGSYLVREFARLVYRVAASSGQIDKIDKHRWLITGATGPLVLEYEVYGFDLSVRGAYLDQFRGFFNGNVVFLAVEGRESEPVLVDILAADGMSDWQVATGLPRAGAEVMGFGRYQAANYEALIDYPVELGQFSHLEFMAEGIPHHLVISGRHNANLPRIAADLAQVCAAQIRLFGDAPFTEYWFLTNVVGDGYGGLEHRNSTALLCNRDDLPAKAEGDKADEYLTFLGLASHEYFHSWNVKSIKPDSFTPYNLHAENYTTLLWAFEGITSYYDDLMLVRCGLLTVEQYLERLSHTLTGVRRGTGRLKQTLEEASFDAWIKYYRPDENASNALLSYYTQGSLAALVLDLTIRQRSQWQKSLDDVMRVLYRDFGKAGRGVSAAEWERVAAEVTGLDLSVLFDQLLRQLDAIPVDEVWAAFGIEHQWRAALSLDDKGGWKDKPNPRFEIGARLENDPVGAKLATVIEGGVAQAAGLAAGDIVIAINGLKVNRANWDKMLGRYEPGSSVELHVFRRDELFVTRLECREPLLSTAGLRLLTGENAARSAWLTV